MLQESLNKDSKNYMNKSDYEFPKGNKDVTCFPGLSQTVMNKIILLRLNVK